tara:strand:- start:19163 stop:19834 length:672 start_codon:yes stop_codon:yes gene_type:complete
MIKKIKLSKLKEYPNNPRKGDVDSIAVSLAAHGQFKPLIVNSENVILAGNHTFKAMQTLGWEEAQVLVVDATEEQAKKIVLVDNRLSDLAEYDYSILSGILGELFDVGDLEATGFDPDAVDNMLEVAVTEFEQFEGGYAISDEELEIIKNKRQNQTPAQESGVPLRDIPIPLKDKEHEKFKEVVLAITRDKGYTSTEAILFCLEYVYNKNKLTKDKWYNFLNK